MPEMSALEHLKIAKRLHFQGLTDDAIREYESVLEIDPDNSDAIAGLRSLGIEPVMRDDASEGAVGHAGGLKTNFFSNQARQDSGGGVKGGIFKFLIFGLGIASAYGLYILVNYLLHYDNITAQQNVDVSFEKPKMKDTEAVVDVKIINLNPAPIKHIKLSYRIADPGDTTLKEGTVELLGQVPAGDRRTFSETSLGPVKGVPAKLSPKLEGLIYGPKPKIKDKLVEQFMKAAAVRDKDALEDYEQLCTDTEDFAPAYVGLGRAYAARGKMEQAIEQYKKAMDIDPMNANAHFCTAVALFYKGANETAAKKAELQEAAKKEIEIAYQIAPDDPEISWNLKYMNNLIKENQKAVARDAAKAKEAAEGKGKKK